MQVEFVFRQGDQLSLNGSFLHEQIDEVLSWLIVDLDGVHARIGQIDVEQMNDPTVGVRRGSVAFQFDMRIVRDRTVVLQQTELARRVQRNIAVRRDFDGQ